MVTRLTILLSAGVLGSFASAIAVGQDMFRREAPDVAGWVISLNGTWEFAGPDSEAFEPAPVPGFWGATEQVKKIGRQEALKWKGATYRRQIDVPADKPGAAVEFDQIRWGGEVRVGGQPAGTYEPGGHSLAVFDVSRLARPGANRLEVRLRGWGALPRHEGKIITVPIGAGNWFGIKDSGIPDDVRLVLYKGARIDTLWITPRADGPACELRTRVIAGPDGWKGRLAVQVVTDDGRRAVSPAKRTDVSAKAWQAVDVTIRDIAAPGADLWWPEKPVLHRLVAWLEGPDGTVAAAREDVFGFREIATKGGDFHLNGRRMRLHGATELVMYSLMELEKDPNRLERVQVDLFKKMNAVAFRSHQNPLSRKWLDLCDRHGILVLSEFANFPDVQAGGQDPYRVPGFWENLQQDIRGIIAARYNHPCIVGWVPSNEGTTYGDWERANLEPFVKSLDPTRLVMFSGDVTPDVADQHNFAGMWWGTQAESVRAVQDLARFYPDRLLGCTEYGQYGAGRRWYGRNDRPDDPAQLEQDRARILMEQTESMRRARFDLIMYYSYGGAGRTANETGRLEDATPSYHALRHALSPLGVSVDFRRHAVAGQRVQVPVWVMSDAEDVKGPVEVKLQLLGRNPGYGWDGGTDGAEMLVGSYETDLAPWQAYHRNLEVPMPKHEGTYWLAAKVKAKGADRYAAISLREVRVYEPLPPARQKLTVGVIDRDARLEKWLKARGHRPVLAYGDEKPDVILIGEGMVYDERLRTHGAPTTTRTRHGTRLVVLEQRDWDASVMQEDIKEPLAGVATWPAQTALENLFPDGELAKTVAAADLQRLNGIDNIALRVSLVPAGEAASAGSTQPARLTPEAGVAVTQPSSTQPSPWAGVLLAYGLKGETPVWAIARRPFERGEVFACQVPLVDRVCTEDPESFDPVAERLLAWLVEPQR